MTRNDRYTGALDKELLEAASRPRAVSLTAEELDFVNHPMVEAKTPLPVRVWVRVTSDAMIHPDAFVIAWTDRAVQIQFRDIHGHLMEAWVHTSAVESRPARN